MRVLAEITEANRVGASADDIHELFKHASELLQIMGEEIGSEPPEGKADMQSVVATLRAPGRIGPGHRATEALTTLNGK